MKKKAGKEYEVVEHVVTSPFVREERASTELLASSQNETSSPCH